MKILYDHQIFYRQNYGGVSRYFCELMNRFSTDPDIHFTLPLRYVQNDNLSQFPQLDKYWSNRYDCLFDNQFISSIQKKIRFNALNFGLNCVINNRAESIRLLQEQDFDIFHPTYYEPYFLKYIQKKPYVVTVYDMIHELFPIYFKTKDKTKVWKKDLVENASAVIAISENTRQDILKFTNTDPSRIHVIYLGNPFEYTSIPEQINPCSDPPVFEKPYLLFVGGRPAYKNFDLFIESVAGILREHEELHVICAGWFPFSSEEKKVFRGLHISHQVHHIKINETILKNLYRNARVFVFPSRYEGFGLPVLEAFSCNCPVIMSNASSLPEIGGDGAGYFDPNDQESIRSAIERVLFNEKYRQDLIQNGSERLKFFSWEKTAVLTKEVYTGLVHP
jgi:glycosyltransferase involved in cell wall biosynthesis